MLVIKSPNSKGQWTVTNGWVWRGLWARSQRARIFLPVPLFPLEEHHTVGLRHTRRGLHEGAEPLAAGLKGDLPFGRLHLRLQLGDLAVQPLGTQHPLGCQAHLVGGERLGQIIHRAVAHGLDCTLNGGIGGDDDDAYPRLPSEDLRQRGEPGVRPEPGIQKHHIKLPAVQGCECSLRRRHAEHPCPADFQTEPE